MLCNGTKKVKMILDFMLANNIDLKTVEKFENQTVGNGSARFRACVRVLFKFTLSAHAHPNILEHS